ncbi:MAG: pilus assembly protein PilM [Pseudohongiella sp.]|nr:pilus assembly protein PilM [Pseudohongiella sp.]MDO9521926.1 pilus assembly protein PilM [Pseudohongiella sp.]
MIGLDIGNRFIKLVALGRHRGSWQLEACIARESGTDPVPGLQAALQSLPSSLRRKPLRVAIALQSTELFIKTVQLPYGLDHNQLDLALRMELGQGSLAAPEEICLDYRLPGRPDHQGPSEQVLAVACRQSLMDVSLNALRSAGVEPALVGADVMLIADDMSSASRNPELELFVDAGATGIRLYSMRSGVPAYSRSHALLNSSGSLDDPAGYLLLLRRAIQQYRMFDMLSKPATIFLYGGAAALSGVQDLLQQSFGMPVRSIHPFSDSQLRERERFVIPEELHESSFTLAYVLAKQDFSCA